MWNVSVSLHIVERCPCKLGTVNLTALPEDRNRSMLETQNWVLVTACSAAVWKDQQPMTWACDSLLVVTWDASLTYHHCSDYKVMKIYLNVSDYMRHNVLH